MMKKILFILFLFCCFSAKAQWNRDDTSKYTWYKYIYGNRLSRMKLDSVLAPPTDTTFSKNGIATKGSTLYVGNGTYWTAASGGGSSADSAIFFTKYRSDTMRANIYTAIASKLSISDTANIRARLVEGNGIVITGSYPNLTIKVDSAAYKTVFDAMQDSTALATAITAKGKLDSVSVVNDSTIKIIRKDGTSYNLVIKGGAGAGGSGSSRVNILAYPLRSDSISPDTSRIYIRQSWQDSALAGISLYNTFLVSTGEIILDTATSEVTVMDNIIFYENGVRDSITSPVSYTIPDASSGKYRIDKIYIKNGAADTVQGQESTAANLFPALPDSSIFVCQVIVFEDSVLSVGTRTVGDLQTAFNASGYPQINVGLTPFAIMSSNIDSEHTGIFFDPNTKDLILGDSTQTGTYLNVNSGVAITAGGITYGANSSNVPLVIDTVSNRIYRQNISGGATPTLQTVTTAGQSTTDSITLLQSTNRLLNLSTYNIGGPFYNGRIDLRTNQNASYMTLLPTSISYRSVFFGGSPQSVNFDPALHGNSNLFFPTSGSTPRYFPVSVNGNYADTLGNITLSVGGSTTPQYFDMIGSGASNMSGRDTSWKALTVTTFPNVQSFNASNTFVTANPNTNNICFSDATTTATRNNTAWQFGIARWKENLTDTVRMVVDAVGGRGSWEWTPQTTGVGEVTTSNTRLTSLITKLDATPLNFKAKVILMQYGETDATSANVQFLDTNIIKFYDTIVKHRAVDTAATMILCYPISNQPINGDSLRMSLDSIYYGIRRMGNRNIIVVPHYYPGTASGHPSNDSTTAIAKRAYSNYKQGIANGPKMPDTALWKKNTSPIFTYTPTKVVVNAASQINSFYPLNVVNTGTSELAIFGRSDNSRSIKLFATSTAGYLMYNNATDKIGVRTNDSSWSVSDSNQTTLGLLVGYNSVQISKPLTITSNSTQSGVAVFTGATTPLRVFNTTTSGGQLELAANASAAGNYTSVKFRQGSLGTFTGGEIKSILNSGASGSHMTFETNKGAGGVETIRLTDSNKVGIGVTSITALLHLKAGTATAWTAPLKFTSGTNLTTPESGAVEFDGTNYFGTASTTRYTFAKTLTATATLDFGSTAAGGVSDLTITVTGAADGDAVSLGVPNGSIVASGNFTAWVSATNTVTVRYSNNDLTTARDPASGTFRASVIKY